MGLPEYSTRQRKRRRGSFSYAVRFVQTAARDGKYTDMIDITVVLTAKSSEQVPTLRELLAKHANLSLQEPGCVRFEAFESQTVANTFVLIERWTSQAELDVHRTAEGFKTIYAPKVLPLVDRVAHVCQMLPGVETP